MIMQRFTNDKGRTFSVNLVQKGDAYGRTDSLVHEDKRGWGDMIEFWDSTVQPGDDCKDLGRGQFVARYYAFSLLSGFDGSVGLDLMGGVPEWKIDAATMRRVCDWIQQVQAGVIV